MVSGVTIDWDVAGGTDVGRVRSGNEDSYRIDLVQGIFLVADGMGGHAAGEVASALAADSVIDMLTPLPGATAEEVEQGLILAYEEAHRRIVECCEGDPRTRGMGTTLTTAVVRPSGEIHVAHIGDSRIYLQRGRELVQVTNDHTWVQQEIDAGRIDADAAQAHPLGHILTRVLTADEPSAPDLYRGTVERGDTILLCSDGLHNMVDAHSLSDLLLADLPVAEIVDRLINSANRRGGPDNITVVLVRIR